MKNQNAEGATELPKVENEPRKWLGMPAMFQVNQLLDILSPDDEWRRKIADIILISMNLLISISLFFKKCYVDISLLPTVL